MHLQLAMTAAPIHTLGPYARFGIWVQGCTRGCPGCVTPEAQPLDGGYSMAVEVLAEEILKDPSLEGITISGGEPMLQSKALCDLIDELKARADLGVILYTGFSYEEIREDPLVKRCDAIIDGEYIEAQNDGRSLRGSSNQRLIHRTDRYRGLMAFGTAPRKMERIPLSQGRTALVGVPTEEAANLAARHRKQRTKEENRHG